MKNLIIAIAMLALSGANLLPAQADDVGKGKVPFMTELDNGKKFYVRTAHKRTTIRTAKMTSTASGKNSTHAKKSNM